MNPLTDALLWPLRLFALLLWVAGWAVAVAAGVGLLAMVFLLGVAVG